MKVKQILINDYGTYESSILTPSKEEFAEMIRISVDYYKSHFEMWNDSGFIIFSPELLRRSILKIEIIEDE